MTQRTTKPGAILVVDDDEDVLQAARLLLKRQFGTVTTEKNPELLPDLLRAQPYDVIMLDMNFTKDVASGREGFMWLDRILEIDPAAVVILITAYGDVDMAVRAIKQGATDFVLKPWNNEKLLATLFSAMRLHESRQEVQTLRAKQQLLSEDLDQKYQDIIGRSQAMRRIFDTIDRVAGTDANILILGENGTGKEVIARALHRHSQRSAEAFVGVDLGAISESLFESELFGHTKGAFTDAKEDRPGRFEAAHRGSLFLDEIGNLSLPLQAKLLAALQNRTVTRVGANKPREIDIRLICATNMPLYDMVSDNRFRQDLLYRINTIELTLPPLRERLDDIPLLAGHFLAQFGKKYQKDIRGLAPTGLRKLQQYNWPGNVRELQHTLERAVIMGAGPMLDADDISLSNPKGASSAGAEPAKDSFNLEGLEEAAIRKALQKHDGNISLAAKELGLTRASLYRRIEKYGL